MRICSVTVTSRTKEGIIWDAIQSIPGCVEHVCLNVIQEGTDQTVRTATIAANLSNATITAKQAEENGGISAWRNEALAQAHQLGFDWALMLDTDWRYIDNGADIRGFLETTTADVVLVRRTDGHYVPAIFRLPATGFEGWTHEALFSQNTAEIPKLRIRELPKSHEEFKHRLELDLDGLHRQLQSRPWDIQWNYMLAETLAGLRRFPEAAPYYLKAAENSKDDGVRAWIQYRLADCLFHHGDFEEAKAVAMSSLLDAPGLAESYWVLSSIAVSERSPRKAIGWARNAIFCGHSDYNMGCKTFRRGLMDVRALYEGPFECLMQAYSQLGMQEDYETSCRRLSQTLAKKEAFLKDGVE